MTVEPLKLGFTKDEFKSYCEDVLPAKMMAWRPRGIVLHNTAVPDLAKVNGYISSGKWTFEQLIDNWWVRYKKLGWPAGPHIFIHEKIWIATPLWMRGTHSPSFNATMWGVEIVGDYSKEFLPALLLDNTVQTAACLYAMQGHEPTPQSLRFHGEDPRTSHKECPGQHIRDKVKWDIEIEQRMAELYPGGDYEKD